MRLREPVRSSPTRTSPAAIANRGLLELRAARAAFERLGGALDLDRVDCRIQELGP
jgi:hypothetical protein